jgi:hypothetical protein
MTALSYHDVTFGLLTAPKWDFPISKVRVSYG